MKEIINRTLTHIRLNIMFNKWHRSRGLQSKEKNLYWEWTCMVWRFRLNQKTKAETIAKELWKHTIKPNFRPMFYSSCQQLLPLIHMLIFPRDALVYKWCFNLVSIQGCLMHIMCRTLGELDVSSSHILYQIGHWSHPFSQNPNQYYCFTCKIKRIDHQFSFLMWAGTK